MLYHIVLSSDIPSAKGARRKEEGKLTLPHVAASDYVYLKQNGSDQRRQYSHMCTKCACGKVQAKVHALYRTQNMPPPKYRDVFEVDARTVMRTTKAVTQRR